MPGVRRFEDLTCWQEAWELARAIEGWIARTSIADANLVDQLRRASISVQVNIAEGFERFAPRDFHRFLTIAKGSLAEVRALLVAACDRGILDRRTHEEVSAQAELLAKRIGHLMKHLRKRPK